MPNLKEVRSRISSVGSTMQITSAMKMVSAAKLKRTQDKVIQMRQYASKLETITNNILNQSANTKNSFITPTKGNKTLLVVITSNRGLAGGFNSNTIKKCWNLIQTTYTNDDVKVLSIGKKAQDVFKKTPLHFELPLSTIQPNSVFDQLTFENAEKIANQILELYTNNTFNKIALVYSSFKSITPNHKHYLPMLSDVTNINNNSNYEIEPNQQLILETILPLNLKVQFYNALLDSFAAEHEARMTAMHKATDNAKDMLRNLKISYNKARQTAITTEILEIVAGAEALNG